MNSNFKIRSRSANYRQIKKNLTSFANIISLRYKSANSLENKIINNPSDVSRLLSSNCEDDIELYQKPGPSKNLSTFNNLEENYSFRSFRDSQNNFINDDENDESEKISVNSSDSASDSFFDQHSFKNIDA